MPETTRDAEASRLPEAVAVKKPRWKLQIIWLIPLLAALIGGWLAVRAIMERGPTITITFKTAEGLEAGKTKLKYKDVDIGLVQSVELSQDLANVVATAELVKTFKPHLVQDTRFWIARPRISGGSVSGIGTLLSGAYIGVDVGRAKEPRSKFSGLETPPVVRLDTPGREYTLQASGAGVFEAGMPVFFRQLPVGQVVGYELNPNGKDVTVKLFVNEPYTKYVNANTRFWNASGVKIRMDANGIRVDTQSVVSILVGGIAFDNPPLQATQVSMPPVSENTQFTLFPDRDEALRNPESDVLKVVMVFEESVRGLSVGAPVDFRGISVGEVTAINLYIDPETRKVLTPVEVNLYPGRLRSRTGGQLSNMPTEEERKRRLDTMVAQGVRAQLKTGSLITGQLYIALDYLPNAQKAKMNWASAPPEIPTAKGNLQEIQTALASVATKLDKLPLEKIGTDVSQTLRTAQALLQRIDTEVTPELRNTVSEARKALSSVDRMLSSEQGVGQETRDAMREMSRAANSFRNLADYLERHPEALIRGRKGEEQ